MVAEIENHTLALLREIRREQELARKDGRAVVEILQSLMQTVTRQGARLERSISDLRDELEATIKIELGGRLVGVESAMEGRQEASLADLRRSVEKLEAEIQAIKERAD